MEARRGWSLAVLLGAMLLAPPVPAVVVGWMGGHSPEPQLAGYTEPVHWFEYGNYQNFSQVSMTLKFPDGLGPYSPFDDAPFGYYAPFRDMTFSAATVGQTWRVEPVGAIKADFDGMVGMVSNGREDWMRWEFAGMTVHSTDLIAFSYGSLPMYGYYHFQGDLAGQEIDWMTLTLESYSEWWSPNTSAYCDWARAGGGGCAEYNNVAFTYLLTFGNNDPDPVPTPEPDSLLLVGLGLIGLAAIRYR
jgi:hypothetical protein